MILLLLFFSPLLLFSCRGEKQWNPSGELELYAGQIKHRLLHRVEISPKDSGYWIGTCWNLWQLTNDSCFRKEAERCMHSIRPVWEYSTIDSDKALQLYLIFSKGFVSTGERHYRHAVWDLADRLLADSLCITARTMEALLWATAYGGCHCFKEAAIRWGSQQSLPLATVEEIEAFGSLYVYTDRLSYWDAISRTDERPLLRSALDSLRLARTYTLLSNHTNNKKQQGKAADILRHLKPLPDFSFEYAYCYADVLLRLTKAYE